MKTKHTPGPWIAHPKEVYSAYSTPEYHLAINKVNGHDIVPHVAGWRKLTKYSQTDSGSYGFSHEEAEANARLIAASPELLEACQAVMSANRGEHLPAEVIIKLAEAISKATQEDPFEIENY